MAEKRIEKLYGGEVEITFYPDIHAYKLKGERSYLISKTGATGTIDKSKQLMKWATRENMEKTIEDIIALGLDETTTERLLEVVRSNVEYYDQKREKAATHGTMVHDFAEQFGKYKLGKAEKPEIKEDLPEEVINGINAFLEWVSEHNVEFIECERLVYSKSNKTVGLLDLLAKVDGVLSLVDYKTSSGVYPEFRAQTAGYKKSYEEETGEKIEQRLLVRFDKETGAFEVHKLDEDEKDIVFYEHTVGVKERLKELESQQREEWKKKQEAAEKDN